MVEQKIDPFGSGMDTGHDQVALVFPILIVGNDQDSALCKLSES
jgi:hypothetical protein